MHPAFSVIFFTVGSGLGYGLLVALVAFSLAFPDSLTVNQRLLCLGVALALVAAGLLSSTAHLGHPERAWRAFSQWRSSWLSREGVAAVLSFLPPLLLSLTWWSGSNESGLWSALTVILAIVTTICTGMIYASLRPIPAWRHPLVVPIYVALSLATGTLALAAYVAIATAASQGLAICAASLSIGAWMLKLAYWKGLDAQSLPEAAAAIGQPLGAQVSLFSGPTTGSSYVTQEMGFRIARKHASKLRSVALISGALLAAGFALASFLGGTLGAIFASLALISGVTGTLVERWLFFAEAKHVATVYFGESNR